eukprot:2322645-Amphidinium_carterae.1
MSCQDIKSRQGAGGFRLEELYSVYGSLCWCIQLLAKHGQRSLQPGPSHVRSSVRPQNVEPIRNDMPQ